MRAINASVLWTESVCEVEDSEVWRKLQQSASESVSCSVKPSLQWLSDKEVLSASFTDLMLAVEKGSGLMMLERINSVQFHIIVIWEAQLKLSYIVCKELCVICWRNEKSLKADRLLYKRRLRKRAGLAYKIKAQLQKVIVELIEYCMKRRLREKADSAYMNKDTTSSWCRATLTD